MKGSRPGCSHTSISTTTNTTLAAATSKCEPPHSLPTFPSPMSDRRCAKTTRLLFVLYPGAHLPHPRHLLHFRALILSLSLSCACNMLTFIVRVRSISVMRTGDLLSSAAGLLRHAFRFYINSRTTSTFFPTNIASISEPLRFRRTRKRRLTFGSPRILFDAPQQLYRLKRSNFVFIFRARES